MVVQGVEGKVQHRMVNLAGVISNIKNSHGAPIWKLSV
jgi:hypothetical protein